MIEGGCKVYLTIDEINVVRRAMEHAQQFFEDGGTEAERQHIIDINQDKWINEEWYDDEKEFEKRIDIEIQKIYDEYESIIRKMNHNSLLDYFE